MLGYSGICGLWWVGWSNSGRCCFDSIQASSQTSLSICVNTSQHAACVHARTSCKAVPAVLVLSEVLEVVLASTWSIFSITILNLVWKYLRTSNTKSSLKYLRTSKYYFRLRYIIQGLATTVLARPWWRQWFLGFTADALKTVHSWFSRISVV